MNKQAWSNKITVISFIAMVAVAMIHSQTASSVPDAAGWNVWFQKFLGSSLTSFAVQFFFMVSGYFFASRPVGYWSMLKKKAKTLLVPYLFWICVGTAIGLPLTMANNHLTHRGLLERTVLGHDTVWQCIDAFFGISGDPQGNVPLWFVRALLILFVCAPLWRIIHRLLKGWIVVPALICALAFPTVNIPGVNVLLRTVGYFMLGMAISGQEDIFEAVSRKGWILYGLLYVGLSAFRTQLPEWCYMLVSFFGILFWFGLYDAVIAKRLADPPLFMKRTFWVYCFHNCWCNWSLAVGLYVLGKNDAASLFIFLFTPLAVVPFCLVAAHVVNKLAPRAYKVVVGDRS